MFSKLVVNIIFIYIDASIIWTYAMYIRTYVDYENGCGTPALIHLTYVHTP